MSEAPLLEARGIARRYDMRQGLFGRAISVRAVDGLSLRVERGRTLGIVGESGSGKSTAGRLALGFEAPDEGEVLFQGAPMPKAGTAAWRRSRARMQMVYQDPLGALDRRLSILDQVREPFDIHGLDTESARKGLALALLQSVGLRADQAHRFPHELSGGQRQRAVIARALATKPDLLVCDEPVSALDVSIQAQVINLLVDIQAKLGLGMLFISHDLKVIRQVSDRVAVMYLGRIVEEGEADAAAVGAGPSLYRSARFGVAGAGPAGAGAHRAAGRAAQSGSAPLGLRLPSALPCACASAAGSRARFCKSCRTAAWQPAMWRMSRRVS